VCRRSKMRRTKANHLTPADDLPPYNVCAQAAGAAKTKPEATPSPKAPIQRGMPRRSSPDRDTTAAAATGGGLASDSNPAPAAPVRAGAGSEQNERKGYAFPLTPVAAPKERRKKLQRGSGGVMEGEEWEEVFNQWVVLEGETLREARKTEQLAFLELEAIKVGGWSRLPQVVLRSSLLFSG